MPEVTKKSCEPTVTAAMLARLCASAPVQLVDVRSPAEFACGHLPCAVNIPMEQIESRLGDLREGCALVLVCQAGSRAHTVADWLRPARPDVLVLEGGTAAWCDAGEPVVRTARTRWSLERQVRLGAGLLVVVGVAFTLGVSRSWIALPAFVGLGLSFAGLTGFCPMASLLALLPWNRPRAAANARPLAAAAVAGTDAGCGPQKTGQQ